MPEYLYPGVYIEEYASDPKSIPGVSTTTEDATGRSLAVEIFEVVRRARPDWTGFNASDPGLTLLELIGWLSEMAIHRVDVIPERGRRAAMRAAAELATLSAPCGQPDEVLTCPRFFAGQLLNATDLEAVVDYTRAKLRRHNRELHGVGVVHGLDVRVEGTSDAPHAQVHVEPGFAIDLCGNDLALGRGAALSLPQSGERLLVSLRHWDRPRSPVPSPFSESMSSHIEEVCVVALVDAVVEPAIALAQLLRLEGRWSVDPCSTKPRKFSP